MMSEIIPTVHAVNYGQRVDIISQLMARELRDRQNECPRGGKKVSPCWPEREHKLIFGGVRWRAANKETLIMIQRQWP